MRTDLSIYGGMLVAGLGVAWWASMPAKDGEADKITLWDINPDTITEINYTTTELTVAAKRDGDSKRFWLQVDKKANEKEPNSKAESDRFLANDEMADVLSGFHPFRAQRSLGKVKDEQLVEFGLKDVGETLKVVTKDGPLDLKLGKKSYGSRNQFALDPKESKVLLVDGKVLQTLGAAKSRLYERRLMISNMEEVSRAIVEAGSKKKTMVRTKKEDGSGFKWSDDIKDSPEKPSYGSWIDKVSKLRALTYSTAEEDGLLAQAKPFLTVSFEKDGAVTDKLEFRKIDLPGTPPPAGKDPQAKAVDKTGFFVTSQFLKVAVRLASARVESLEKDMPSILE